MSQCAVLDPPPLTSRLAPTRLSGATLIVQGQRQRLCHPHPFQLTYCSPLERGETEIAVDWSRGELRLLPGSVQVRVSHAAPQPSLLPLFPRVPTTCPYGCSEHRGVTLAPMGQDRGNLLQGLVLFSWYSIS